MAAKVFLDANVLLNFLLKRKQYDQSKKLIQIVESGAIRAYVTPPIIHINRYWLGKQYSKSTAKQILLELLSQIR
jgi:predicted nucleic acid-binding protein